MSEQENIFDGVSGQAKVNITNKGDIDPVYQNILVQMPAPKTQSDISLSDIYTEYSQLITAWKSAIYKAREVFPSDGSFNNSKAPELRGKLEFVAMRANKVKHLLYIKGITDLSDYKFVWMTPSEALKEIERMENSVGRGRGCGGCGCFCVLLITFGFAIFLAVL